MTLVISFILLIIGQAPAFAQEGISDYLCEIGEGYYLKGQYNDALREFNKALMVNPESPKAKSYIRKITVRLKPQAVREIEPAQKEISKPISKSSLPAKESVGTEQRSVPTKTEIADRGQPLQRKIIPLDKSREPSIEPVQPIKKTLPPVVAPEPRKYLPSTVKPEGDGAASHSRSHKKEPAPPALSKGQVVDLALAKFEKELTQPIELQPIQREQPSDKAAKKAPGPQGVVVKGGGAKDKEFGQKDIALEETSAFKISGEVRLGVGLTSEDVIWKDANSDKIGVPREKNWRYLWGDMRHNTYDAKIYDRLNLVVESQFESPFNVLMDFTLDPWTFIGKNHVAVNSTAGGDTVEMDLKYWSGDSRTLNEVYRSKKGNIINLKQVKVDDGDTTVTTPTGISDWGTNYNPIQPMEVNLDYRPVRKLWFNYNKDEYAWKIFPISDEYEALTSDDPLRISNNHVYWEESPWLDEYEPSVVFEPDSGTFPLKKGRWIRKLSFVTKDSSDDYPHRLTFLRGASFKTLNQSYSFEAAVATPMSLWDEYYRSNSVAGASRLKIPLQDDLEVGLTTTTKVGLNGGSAEALNQVEAVDLSYQVAPLNSVYLEAAESHTEIQEAKGFDTAYDGVAAKAGFDYDAAKEKTSGLYASEIYLAHMDYNFYPGLSNYRYTRNDEPTFSRHIYFSEMKEEDKALIWGDGMDRGRNAAGFKFNLRSFDEALDTDVRYRNVHKHSGKYVESALRAETTYKATEKFTSKILSYYKHLPRTHAKYDPLMYAKTMYSLTDYFSEEDIYAENSNIIDDKDPSVGAFGLGGKYDFTEQFSLEGIYTRTNDPLDFPRGLLNDTYVTTEIRDGVVWDKVVPFLYDQKFFDLPPYHYYNIAKSKLIYTPVKEWKFIFSFTFNENKYASGIDDNVNHAGLEADFMPTDKLTFWFKYMHTRLIDIYKQNKYQHNDFYEGHHNVFFGSEYRFSKDDSFTLLYGEFVGYNDPYQQTYWTLSALDTQHIFRLFYRRKF